MSNPGDLSKEKCQSHPHRKRTVFTKKQLADMNLFFNTNPYPTPSLQREMASKMEMHPRALKVWFKNRRVKLEKAKCKDFQPAHEAQREAQQRPLAEARVRISSSRGQTTTTPRNPHAASPASLVYTDHPRPSFQLSVWTSFKTLTHQPLGHKMVHFGCCQDPNIYCLSPISESQAPSTSFCSNSLGLLSSQRTQRR
ncbi:divergent paired-related homeobox [Phacochoerus africanus]|uniref:divergent paired-related homeobox n=1 Tax=Phacochoerus africanus TaxID=41426 RepID=UPI001FDA30C3|nr:divergent paired-related homeobox [Phacochoerus africanus]